MTKAETTQAAADAVELATMRAERDAAIAKLAAKTKVRPLSAKIGGKGGMSVYGFGRFPVTLYRQQWRKLWEATAMLQEFMAENDALMAERELNPIEVRKD